MIQTISHTNITPKLVSTTGTSAVSSLPEGLLQSAKCIIGEVGLLYRKALEEDPSPTPIDPSMKALTEAAVSDGRPFEEVLRNYFSPLFSLHAPLLNLLARDRPHSLPTDIKKDRLQGIHDVHSAILLLGDEILKESPLEGAPIDKSITFLMCWLEFFLTHSNYFSPEERPEIQAIIEKLAQIVTKKSSNLDLKTTISSLGIGKSYTFAASISKHVLIFEIQKRSDGSYDLTLFNSGLGIEHHASAFVGKKMKHTAALRFGEIPFEKLSHTLFLIQSWSFHTQKEIHIVRLYRYLFLQYKENLLISQERVVKTKSLITPQRSGTCTIRGPLALLRESTSDVTYKKTLFLLKLFSLHNLFNQVEHNLINPGFHRTSENRALCQILEAACNNLQNTLLKKIYTPIYQDVISPHIREFALLATHYWQTKFHVGKMLSLSHQRLTHIEALPNLLTTYSGPLPSLLAPVEVFSGQFGIKEHFNAFELAANPDTLPRILNLIEKMLNDVEINPDVRVRECVRFIEAIPFPLQSPDYWDRLCNQPLPLLCDLIKNLDSIFEKFAIYASYTSSPVLLHHAHAATKLFFILFKLVRHIETSDGTLGLSITDFCNPWLNYHFPLNSITKEKCDALSWNTSYDNISLHKDFLDAMQIRIAFERTPLLYTEALKYSSLFTDFFTRGQRFLVSDETLKNNGEKSSLIAYFTAMFQKSTDVPPKPIDFKFFIDECLQKTNSNLPASIILRCLFFLKRFHSNYHIPHMNKGFTFPINWIPIPLKNDFVLSVRSLGNQNCSCYFERTFSLPSHLEYKTSFLAKHLLIRLKLAPDPLKEGRLLNFQQYSYEDTISRGATEIALSHLSRDALSHKLQTVKLLYYTIYNQELISNQTFMFSFEALLLRSLLSSKHSLVLLGTEIEKLCKAFTLFFDTFLRPYDSITDTTPEVIGLMSIVRIAVILRDHLTKSLPHQALLTIIHSQITRFNFDLWIEKASSLDDQILLRWHRLFEHLLRDPTTLKHDEISKILEDRIQTAKYSISPLHRYPHIEHQVMMMINRLKGSRFFSLFTKEMFSLVLNESIISIDLAPMENGLFLLTNSSGKRYNFSLETGTLFLMGDEKALSIDPIQVMQTENFDAVFPDIIHEFTPKRDGIYFKSKSGITHRIVKRHQTDKTLYFLQRQTEGGDWIEYLPRESVPTTISEGTVYISMPSAPARLALYSLFSTTSLETVFLAQTDFHIFIGDTTTARRLTKLHFIDSKTLEIRYSIDSSGNLCHEPSGYRAHCYSVMNPLVPFPISQFEHPEMIMIHCDPDNRPSQLIFSRYRDETDSSTLSFTLSRDSRWQWNQNRDYILHPVDTYPLLDTFSGCLTLTHKRDPKKNIILIPLDTIKKTDTDFERDSLSPHSIQWKSVTKKSHFNSPSEGTLKYIVVEIGDEAILPQSQLAHLQLIYTLLAARNYAKALALLRELHFSETFAPTSLELLSAIANFPLEYKESSPGLTTVSLYAHLVHSHINMQNCNPLPANLMSSYLKYLNQLNNGHFDVSLTRMEELQIVSFLEKSNPTNHSLKERKIELLTGEASYLHEITPCIALESLEFPLGKIDATKTLQPSPDKLKEQDYQTLFQTFSFLMKSVSFQNDPTYIDFCKKALQTIKSGSIEEIQILEGCLYLLSGAIPYHDLGIIHFNQLLIELKKKLPKEHPSPSQYQWDAKYNVAFKPLTSLTLPSIDSVPHHIPLLTGAPLTSSRTPPLQTFIDRIRSSSAIPKSGGNTSLNLLDDPFYVLVGTLNQDPLKIAKVTQLHPRYHHILTRDLTRMLAHYQEAADWLEFPYLYTITESSAHSLIPELDNEIKRLKSLIHEKKTALLYRANRGSHSDPAQDSVDFLLLSRKTTKMIDIPCLIRLLLSRNRHYYSVCNRHLSDIDIQILFDETIYYMVISIAYDQLSRLKFSAEKVLAHDVQGIALWNETLKQTMRYNPNEDLELLALEFGTHKMARTEPDQMKMLSALTTSDGSLSLCYPMIAGGGKTTFIMPLLLALSNGEVPLAIVPSPQYLSFIRIMGQILKESFNIEIISFDFERSDLSVDTLEYIQSLLTTCKTSSHFDEPKALVLKKEMIKILALEFVSAWEEMRKGPGSPQKITKFNLLRDILVLLEETKPLGDETHIILDILDEVNFTLGMPTKMNKDHTDIIDEIIYYLLDDATTNSIVRLLENKQAHLCERDYYKTVVPTLALKLGEFFSREKEYLNPTHVESYLDYIGGKIPANVERFVLNILDPKENFDPADPTNARHIAFIQYLRSLNRSPESKLAADCIAFSRHILLELLPSVFKSTGKVDFGPIDDPKRPGYVGPYLSANTPATTEFGYEYEAYIYFLMSGLQNDIPSSLFELYGKTLQENAALFVSLTKIPYEDTPAAQNFLNLTECSLRDATKPETVQKALLHLNKGSSRTKIDFISWSAHKYIDVYGERLSATAVFFMELIKSLRTFTGTPWIFDSLHRKIVQQGLDPSSIIIDCKVLRKSITSTKPHSIHVIEITSPGEYLELVLTRHPKPETVRSLADPGALNKNCTSNYTIAKELLSVLKKRGSPIKAIFYFDRIGKESSSNRPALLLDMDKPPQFIDFPSNLEYAKYDLTPDEVFTYFDASHCYGTDAPIPTGSEGIVLVDNNRLSEINQTLLRHRNFLFDPGTIILVPKHYADRLGQFESTGRSYTFQELVRCGKTKEAMALLAIEAIAKQCEDGGFRAFQSLKKQVDAIFLSIIHNYLKRLSADDHEKSDFVLLHLSPFIRITQSSDLFALHGSILTEESSVSQVITYANQKLRYFIEALQFIDPTDALEMQSNAEILIREFITFTQTPTTIQSLPSSMPISVIAQQGIVSCSAVGAQVLVQQQLDVSIQIDREIQRLLQQYNAQKTETEPRGAPPKKEDDIRQLLEELRSFRKGECLHIAEVLTPSTSLPMLPDLRYQDDFSEIFKDCLLFATKDFLLSRQICATKDPLHFPIFSDYARKFETILVIQTKTTSPQSRYIALSTLEAEGFKKYLKKYRPPGMWLTTNSGGVIEGSLSPPNSFEDREIWILLHVLAGEFNYLIKHIFETDRWMRKIEQTPEGALTLYKFMKHTAMLSSASELDLLERHLKTAALREALIAQHQQVFEHVATMSRCEYTPAEIEALTNKNAIEALSPSQIPYLIRKEQIDLLRLHQIKYLTKVQAHFVNEPTKIRELSYEAIEGIRFDQVTFITKPACIGAIPHLYFAHLTDKLFNPGNVQFLQPPQIRELRCTVLIQQVPTAYISAIAPEMIPAYLAYQQSIGQDISNLFNRLDDRALLPFDESYLLYLTPDRIHSIEFLILIDILKRVPFTNLDFYRRLSLDQLKQIAQIDDLNENLKKVIECQENEIIKNLLSDTGIKPHLLSQERLNELPKECYVWFSNEQLKLLSIANIRQIIDPDLIRRLPEAAFNHLQPDQVRHLTDDQIHTISNVELIRSFGQDLFARLSPTQLICINPASIKQIRDANFLRQLPEALFNHFAPIQVGRLRPDQIQTITNVDLIRSLDPVFFSDLSFLQLEMLTPDNIHDIDDFNLLQRLPEAQLNHLLPDQVRHLTTPQIQTITNVDLIRSLPRSLTSHLSPKQLAHRQPIPNVAPPNQPPGPLTPDQVQQIRSKDLLKGLAKHQIKHIHSSMVKHLTNTEIPLLEKPEQIQKLSLSRLQHLRPSQLQKMNKMQKMVYATRALGLLILGLISFIPTLIVAGTIVLCAKKTSRKIFTKTTNAITLFPRTVCLL